ncbi:MAG: hypothetical protein Q9167_007743 [Letrouitia subvulpina]
MYQQISHNPFETLGVPLDADEILIGKAFRNLTLENHPGQKPEGLKQEYLNEIIKIREAYDMLIDPSARARYSKLCRTPYDEFSRVPPRAPTPPLPPPRYISALEMRLGSGNRYSSLDESKERDWTHSRSEEPAQERSLVTEGVSRKEISESGKELLEFGEKRKMSECIDNDSCRESDSNSDEKSSYLPRIGRGRQDFQESLTRSRGLHQVCRLGLDGVESMEGLLRSRKLRNLPHPNLLVTTAHMEDQGHEMPETIGTVESASFGSRAREMLRSSENTTCIESKTEDINKDAPKQSPASISAGQDYFDTMKKLPEYQICYICEEIIEPLAKRAWQKHVLYDLKPYQCLEEACLEEDATYASLHELKAHYIDMHPRAEIVYKSETNQFMSCPFCNEILEPLPSRSPPSSVLRSRFKHVGRHMENIAFAVVPRQYENWEFYSESTSGSG